MRGFAVLALIVLLAPLVAVAHAGHDAEAPWWSDTLLDRDHDGLDDALEAPGLPLEPRVVLVDYAQMPTEAQTDALERAGFVVVNAYHNFPLLAVRAAPSRLLELRQMPGVVLVEQDATMRPLLKDSVPLIGAPQVWAQYGATGKGITIAVLDDGAFEQHPDLQPRLEAHFDASQPDSPTSGGPLQVIAPAANSEGHGTHVAGIVVGSGAQSGGTYRGVAPDAKFANVKVFDSASSTSSSIVLRGLDWVLDNAKAHNIRIASMSLGGTPSDGRDAICNAVNIAVDKGLVVVAAAGNAGPNPKTITAPGAAAKAITVGAVDKSKKVAPYSSRGPTPGTLQPKPDIVAPGSDITSTLPPTQSAGGILTGSTTAFYGALSGTSMAAPHVSGVVAMMLQVNPDLSPKEVKDILLATSAQTQDLGPKGRDNDTGYGFVNAVAAVQVAKNPSMLDEPRFASVLATIPDPPRSSFLERASYDFQSIQRDGQLPLLGFVVVGAVGIVLIAVAIARRR